MENFLNIVFIVIKPVAQRPVTIPQLKDNLNFPFWQYCSPKTKRPRFLTERGFKSDSVVSNIEDLLRESPRLPKQPPPLQPPQANLYWYSPHFNNLRTISSRSKNGWRSKIEFYCFDWSYSFDLYLFIEREFRITLIEEKAMAAAAITGFKRKPKKGYKIPAAIGIPTVL